MVWSAGNAGCVMLIIAVSGVPVLSVEAATKFGWERYADDSVSIERFGVNWRRDDGSVTNW